MLIPSQSIISVGTLDHYAMAVRDAEVVARFYIDFLGFTHIRTQDIVDESSNHQGDARLVTLAMPGDTKQLVIGMPLHPNSAMHATIDRVGEGVHHVAYQVDDLLETVETLRQAGVTFTTPEIVRDPGTGLRQMFIKREHAGGIFVELLERSESKPEGFVAGNIAKLLSSEL